MFFQSEQMTVAHYDIDAGATLHVHSHTNRPGPSSKIELEVTIDGVALLAGPGCAAVIPRMPCTRRER